MTAKNKKNPVDNNEEKNVETIVESIELDDVLVDGNDELDDVDPLGEEATFADLLQAVAESNTIDENHQEDFDLLDDGLVAMENDGEVLRVHPSCVEAHLQAGWSVVE